MPPDYGLWNLTGSPAFYDSLRGLLNRSKEPLHNLGGLVAKCIFSMLITLQNLAHKTITQLGNECFTALRQWFLLKTHGRGVRSVTDGKGFPQPC